MNKKWLGLWAVPFLALNLGASNRDIWVQEKLIIHSIKYFPFSPGKIQQIDVDITWKVAVTTRLHIITHVGDAEYLTPPKGESLGLHPRNPGQRMVYSFYVPPEHYPSDGNGPVYLQILSRNGGYVSHGTVMHCREPETFRLEGEPLGTYTFKWLESYITEDGGDRYTITDYEKVRFEGMQPVFYGGRTNALPMDRWKATSHYLWGKKESFECEKATLYLLKDYDRLEIGYETMYERRPTLDSGWPRKRKSALTDVIKGGKGRAASSIKPAATCSFRRWKGTCRQPMNSSSSSKGPTSVAGWNTSTHSPM